MLKVPKRLVETLKAHGFEWGGDYKDHKDFMHFEYGGADPSKIKGLEKDSPTKDRPLSDLLLDAHHEARKASTERKVSKGRPK
jgi:D-alanyl-D-alanine carboxypeptidase